MTDAVDLELALRTVDRVQFWAEVRYRVPGTAGVRDTSRDTLAVQIKQEDLLACAGNAGDYGRTLASMLFGNAMLAQTIAEARSAAATLKLPLRFQLHLVAEAETLHTLRWETLHDLPADGGAPLATSTQVLFSRYISTTNRWAHRQPRALQRALVVVANPTDLANLGFSPVDATQELKLIRDTFGDAQTTVLDAGKATLAGLSQHLNAGCDMLYLLAHGHTDDDGNTWLYLEDENRRTARAQGREIVQLMSTQINRPSLIILGACQSAGNGHAPPMLALGPMLAAAGIPAVLAMQDRISIETMQHFLPACLKALYEGDPIDLAVAKARRIIHDQPDAWIPVLFLCLYGNPDAQNQAKQADVSRLREALGRFCARQVRLPEPYLTTYTAGPELEQLANMLLEHTTPSSSLDHMVAHLDHHVDGIAYILRDIALAKGEKAIEPIVDLLDVATISEMSIGLPWIWYVRLWSICKHTTEDLDQHALQIYSRIVANYKDAPYLPNKTKTQQICHFLAKYSTFNQNTPPLVDFAIEFQKHLNSFHILYYPLQQWISSYCAVMNIKYTTNNSSATDITHNIAPILIMELQEIEEDCYQLRIWSTKNPKQQDDWHSDLQLCRTGRVSWSKFLALFGEIAQHRIYQNAERIEVFLPNSLIFRDMESTPLTDPDFPNSSSSPGYVWPIVRRFQKRCQILQKSLPDRIPIFMKHWRTRWECWEQTRVQSATHCQRGQQPDLETLPLLRLSQMANQNEEKEIRQKPETPFVVAQGNKNNREICTRLAEALIKTGVPIALWCHTSAPLEARAQEVLGDLIKASWNAAGDFPRALHKLRQSTFHPQSEEAQSVEQKSEEALIVEQILLFWDAPDQLPPDLNLQAVGY